MIEMKSVIGERAALDSVYITKERKSNEQLG